MYANVYIQDSIPQLYFLCFCGTGESNSGLMLARQAP